MNSASQGAPKKRYEKPNVKTYGDIQALTATVATPGTMVDGPSAKTH
jgi:hypothetical protein